VKRLSSLVGFLGALAIIGVAAWAVVRGIDKDPGVVGPFATALGAVAVVLVQRNREKRQELEKAHREQMAPIYEELVTKLKDYDATKQASNIKFFKSAQTKLLLYGPTPVLKAWIAWLRTGTSNDLENPALLLAYERLLVAVRADLGHDNAGLEPGDLLRVYVNDIDDAMARSTSSSGAT
jgi:hypothetical protein